MFLPGGHIRYLARDSLRKACESDEVSETEIQPNTNTRSPSQLGRLTHYAFDAVLLSAFLAGVKRSTGLTYSSPLSHSLNPLFLSHDTSLTLPSPSFKPDSLTESKELKTWVEKYLGVGEWVMDQSVAIMGSSGYFERKR